MGVVKMAETEELITNLPLSSNICDPFCENVPKIEKTTIEIRLKVGNNSIFSK